MSIWSTGLPRNNGPNRYRNEDVTSLGAFVPGIFDPANPVFHGTNTGTAWTGVFGNGGLNTTTVGPDAKTLTTPSSAYGWKAQVDAAGGVAMGVSSATAIVRAVGANSVAIGTAGTIGVTATGAQDVVVGSGVGSTSTFGKNTVFGSNCGIVAPSAGINGYFGTSGSIAGTNNWVFGQSIIVGNDTITVGNMTGGTGDRNVYLGASLAAPPTNTGNDQTHVGSGTGSSTANGTTSVGAATTANAAGASAFGFQAQATAANATSIGSGITNAVAQSTIIGGNAVPALRIPNPTSATIINTITPAIVAGAAPAPTVQDVATGMCVLTEPGAVTFTWTNITGALLDAFASFAPLQVGMTFETIVVGPDATTDIAFAGTHNVAASGVTPFGDLAAQGATTLRRIRFVRTGAAAWSAAIF